MSHKEEIKYSGALNDSVGTNLTQLVLAALTTYMKNVSDVKRLGRVALELIDNAHRYATDGKVLFKIVNRSTHVEISLLNSATKNDAERLKQSVEFVNGLSGEEVKKLYRDQLLNPEFGEKGGAGLGLLFIKGKGTNQFNVVITPVEIDSYDCEFNIVFQI